MRKILNIFIFLNVKAKMKKNTVYFHIFKEKIYKSEKIFTYFFAKTPKEVNM